MAASTQRAVMSLQRIQTVCLRGATSALHTAKKTTTNMETMTHSIYTIFLPTTLLHENICAVHLAAWRMYRVVARAQGAVVCNTTSEHSVHRAALPPPRRPPPLPCIRHLYPLHCLSKLTSIPACQLPRSRRLQGAQQKATRGERPPHKYPHAARLPSPPPLSLPPPVFAP